MIRHGSAGSQLAPAVRQAVPALLYGLRFAASVCLALYLAFWLQLDNPSWAGTSAAIALQPVLLGSVLRRSRFLMLGSLAGAVAVVTVTAIFPQDRVGFLLAITLWIGLCGFVGSALRNFAAYGAALAGYTTVIIFNFSSATPDNVFLLAVFRVTEICLGVACAALVLTLTDFGGARCRLFDTLAAITGTIAGRLVRTLAEAGTGAPDTRPARRELIKRVAALDPVIDEAIGETSILYRRVAVLRAAVGGLFAALSGWRIVALHLEALPPEQARCQAARVLRALPPALRDLSPEDSEAAAWAASSALHRATCQRAAHALAALATDEPSQRLLADRTAEALRGLGRALNGLTLLGDPLRAVEPHRVPGRRGVDPLPGLVNAGRASVTFLVAALIWITTEWSNGTSLITYGVVITLLFGPTDEQARTTTVYFMLGAALTTALAAVAYLAVLPGCETYFAFALTVSAAVVPLAAASTLPFPGALALRIAAIQFVPILGPANEMTYDEQAFYNKAIGILAGGMLGVVMLRLVPPVPPAIRSRRLLARTLADLRATMSGVLVLSREAWQSRVYDRLTALPPQAKPVEGARLVTALAVGEEAIKLRRIAPRFDLRPELDAALAALARGELPAAVRGLRAFDGRLAAMPAHHPGAHPRLRARATVLALVEAIEAHAAYLAADTA